MITHIYVTLYIIVTIKLLSGRLSLYAQAIIGTKIYAYTIYRLAMTKEERRKLKYYKSVNFTASFVKVHVIANSCTLARI